MRLQVSGDRIELGTKHRRFGQQDARAILEGIRPESRPDDGTIVPFVGSRDSQERRQQGILSGCGIGGQLDRESLLTTGELCKVVQDETAVKGLLDAVDALDFDIQHQPSIVDDPKLLQVFLK